MLNSSCLRQLNPEFVRTDLLVVLALQETDRGTQTTCTCQVSTVYGSKFALTTLLISEQVSRVQRSESSEERCLGVLLGSTQVMSVYAPDSGKVLKITRCSWRNFEKI